MRHLKVKVELLRPYHQSAIITIVEQTHLFEEFGGYPEGVGRKRFVWGEVALVSDWAGSVQFNPVTFVRETERAGAKVTLNVLPNDSPGWRVKKVSCNIDPNYWPQIREAVEAYNRIYND